MTRGCGELAHDALYHYWPLGRNGIPIRLLTLCPIWVLDRVKLGISYQGVTLLPRLDIAGIPETTSNGKPIVDIYDIVGRKHYPYKTDFYEEGKAQGFSRRWPTNVDVSLLTPGISVHYLCTDAAAYEINVAENIRDEVNACGLHVCFKGVWEHKLPFDDKFYDTCTAEWYHEIPARECHQSPPAPGLYRYTKGASPYLVHPRQLEPKWRFGAFMALPIGTFMATTPRGSDTLSEKIQKPVIKLNDLGVPVVIAKLNTDLPENEEDD